MDLEPVTNWALAFVTAAHVVWEGCYVMFFMLCFTVVILYIFFVISASLISAVRQPIWLKIGTLSGSWFNL